MKGFWCKRGFNRVATMTGLLLGMAPHAQAQLTLNWYTIDGGGRTFSTASGVAAIAKV